MKNDFENIAFMSAQFQARMLGVKEPESGTGPLEPHECAYWQLRILLSIAQQLSVIAGHLKGES